MKLQDTIEAYGTTEGLEKAWEIRPRAPDRSSTKCVHPWCDPEITIGSKEMPHLDHLEFEMSSAQKDNNVRFDKEALKVMLKQALVELDREEPAIEYLNTAKAGKVGEGGTDHYVTVLFQRPGVLMNSGEKR